MTETTNRRSFVGGLMALTLGAGTVTGDPPELPDDVRKLCNWFGEDAVLRHLGEMLSAGKDVTYVTLKRSLNRERNRERRHAKSRERRENHCNSVIYRGIVSIPHVADLLVGLRPVKSAVTRRCLLIGELDKFWLGEYQLPRATRLLVDNRRELRSLCMGEFVHTAKDRYPYRLHLYQPSQWTDDRDPGENAVVLTADAPERHRMSEEKLDELYAVQDQF